MGPLPGTDFRRRRGVAGIATVHLTMRPFPLLLLLQAAPAIQTAEADSARHGGSDCAQEPRRPDPASDHQDHDPGLPRRACNTPAGLARRDCASLGTALFATGVALTEGSLPGATIVLPPTTAPTAPIGKPFHPPRV